MEENFSPQQSLQLIENMIRKVRSDISENRFYFLFWGWLAFSALLAQFILKVVLQYRHHYLVWLVTVPAVVITIMRANSRTRHRYATYIGDSMKHLWIGSAKLQASFFSAKFILLILKTLTKSPPAK